MKPTLVIMMAATLLAGNLPALTFQETDALINRIVALRQSPTASPVAVSALIDEAKAASASVQWTHGEQITPEQKRANDLIFVTANLMGLKVSFATARDYSVEKNAWEPAVMYGRRLPDPRVAITYAQNWVAADPVSLAAKIELLLVRATEGKEDIRVDLDALLAANPGKLTYLHTARAIRAWDAATHLDSPPVSLANAKAFLGRLAAATDPDPNNLRAARVHTLCYRASLEENVNPEIVELLGEMNGTLIQARAELLYAAFKPASATNAETLAFYDALLRSVEANAQSAPFLRKILDQKLKLQ